MLNKLYKLNFNYQKKDIKNKDKQQISTIQSKQALQRSYSCPPMGRRNAVYEKSANERKQIKQTLKREKQISLLRQYGIFWG